MKTYTFPKGAHRPRPLFIPCPRLRRTINFTFSLEDVPETPNLQWNKVKGWKAGKRGLRCAYRLNDGYIELAAYIGSGGGFEQLAKARIVASYPATDMPKIRCLIYADGYFVLMFSGRAYGWHTNEETPRISLTSGPWFGGALPSPSEHKIIFY